MTKVFSPEAVAEFGKQYHIKVKQTPRGGCMRAVYIGLGALYGKDFGFRGAFHKSFFRRARRKERQRGIKEGRLNTIDRVFRALVHEGIAFQELTFTQSTGQTWKTDDGFRVSSIEDTLKMKVLNLPDGSHFFGGAISGAIHSVILRAEKHGSKVEFYWMDQFSDGFNAVRPHAFVETPKVSSQLDKVIRRFGKHATRFWLFDPEGASDVGIEIDSDGDGVNDMSVAAVLTP